MKIQARAEKHLLGSASAFSLLELLTAMAVLAMVMGMLLQITDGILRSTRLQSQQMDSTGAARRALDTLALDISYAVVGESSAVLVTPAATNLALIANRRGTNNGDHRFLAVTYNFNANNRQLLRTYRSVSYSETNLLAAATDTNSAANSLLASGILGLSIRVTTASGPQLLASTSTSNYATTTYNGFTVPSAWRALISTSPTFSSRLTNRAQGLDVWIAAVDSQNQSLLSDTGTFNALISSLGSDPSLWRGIIDQANMPLPAKSSIQVLNKTIPLP